jgi:hypothetical protein
VHARDIKQTYRVRAEEYDMRMQDNITDEEMQDDIRHSQCKTTSYMCIQETLE